MANLFTGEPYKVNPSSVKFDTSIVEFSRVHSKEEYEATKLSIKQSGQIYPICINDQTGLCEDGRHRVKACAELGIDVLCVQVNGNASIRDRLALYNIGDMSGRDLSPAQKAIQAHKFILLTGTKLKTAAAMFKSTVREVSDANAIAGMGRNDILDVITEAGSYQIPGRPKPSKSLRAIAAHFRAIEEEVEVNAEEEIHIDYTEFINTERGKSEYYGLLTTVGASYHELKVLIVNYLNYKYQLKVNPTTGEVDETVADKPPKK